MFAISEGATAVCILGGKWFNFLRALDHGDETLLWVLHSAISNKMLYHIECRIRTFWWAGPGVHVQLASYTKSREIW